MQNDVIASIVARHPTRFLGAGGLPLQAPDLAVKELERIVTTLRFPAVEIGGNVDGRDLDDASLDPVWTAAAALGVAVLVHPQAPILGDARFRKDNLTQVAGFPLETALTMTRVIFGGVLDRWPAIRWCFAHGGGAFPYILPRLDKGWQVADAARAAIPEPPEPLRAPRVDRLADAFAPRARASRSRPSAASGSSSAATIRSGWAWTTRWARSSRSASMRPRAAGSPPTMPAIFSRLHRVAVGMERSFSCVGCTREIRCLELT